MSDELRDLGRELRQGAGRELREEAATDEELSEMQRRRRLDLASVARMAMHRGDRVTVAAGGLTLGDQLLAVGDDYLTMASDPGVVDVALEGAIVTVEPRREGGKSGRPASRTFRARLAELEQDDSVAEVVTHSGMRTRGRIEVAASDHLMIAEESALTYVPYGEIAVVFSRNPPRPD